MINRFLNIINPFHYSEHYTTSAINLTLVKWVECLPMVQETWVLLMCYFWLNEFCLPFLYLFPNLLPTLRNFKGRILSLE